LEEEPVNQANPDTTPAMDDRQAGEAQISFLNLIRNGTVLVEGKSCGRVDDLVVQLHPNDHAEVTLLVVNDGGQKSYILAENILDIREDAVELKADKRAFKPSELEQGELSLRSDILCQRVIDIARGALVKAYDVRLARRGPNWVAAALDVHRGRWFGFGSHSAHSAVDWRCFLPLASIRGTAAAQSASWIGRLKPAQIADLIEEATAEEQDKLLEQVHSDPELEADVFEELEDDSQAQVFKSLSDSEVADVLSRMRADDVADAVMELAQERRQTVLDLLPMQQRTKVLTLLGYNKATAGGLMGTEFLALPEETSVGNALESVRAATSCQPEALNTIHSIAADGRLAGTLGLVQALQSDPKVSLREAADQNIVAASPEEDMLSVINRMADFNLLSLPVVDDDQRLLGIVTVDDALEAAIPRRWANR
jgi:CBS domain-containing protein